MSWQGAVRPAPPSIWLTPLTKALGRVHRAPVSGHYPGTRKLQGQLSQQHCPQAFCIKTHLICKATKATYFPEEKAQGQQRVNDRIRLEPGLQVQKPHSQPRSHMAFLISLIFSPWARDGCPRLTAAPIRLTWYSASGSPSCSCSDPHSWPSSPKGGKKPSHTKQDRSPFHSPFFQGESMRHLRSGYECPRCSEVP